MWPADQAWRAPVGDFPPPWASAWGDDPYGLWADLTVNGITQRMRWIEPSGPEGFWMGSTDDERHRIYDRDDFEWARLSECNMPGQVIENGFWLADTPCTQALWVAVMGDNPSDFSKEPDAALRPVEQVSWDDVKKFELRFSERQAWGSEERICLPTEFQWEYAARAGSITAYWWGDIANSTMANWNGEHGGTTPVKNYAANPWGLFDVHGNVFEWCEDSWQQRLDEPKIHSDPKTKAVKGGSWANNSDLARSAFRFRGPRISRYSGQGFRFALRSSSQGVEPQ